MVLKKCLKHTYNTPFLICIWAIQLVQKSDIMTLILKKKEKKKKL